jgi:hypothetical protein
MRQWSLGRGKLHSGGKHRLHLQGRNVHSVYPEDENHTFVQNVLITYKTSVWVQARSSSTGQMTPWDRHFYCWSTVYRPLPEFVTGLREGTSLPAEQYYRLTCHSSRRILRLDFIHRQIFFSLKTTFRKLALLPSSGKKVGKKWHLVCGVPGPVTETSSF